MHRFWEIQDQMMAINEMVNFTKNLALAGAVLILLALTWMQGAGPLSLLSLTG